MCKKQVQFPGKASWTRYLSTLTNNKPTRSPTDYETLVYKLCALIPKGKVSTYGEMAKALKSSPRAIGQAMRRNPYAPIIPCHRVVASDLDVGGFSGSWGHSCANVQRKRALLEKEGVKFDENYKVASKTYVALADDLAMLLAADAKAAVV